MKSSLTLLLPIVLLLFSVQAFTQEHDHQEDQIETCDFDRQLNKYIEEDPIHKREIDHYLNNILPAVKNITSLRNNGDPYTIPVVFHIATGGDPVGTRFNISEEQVLAQVEFTNLHFFAENPGFEDVPDRWANIVGNPNIQLCLAAKDENGNSTNGIIRYDQQVSGDAEINQFQNQNNWDPNRYLNVYVVDLGSQGLAGFARFPTSDIVGSWRDGIVMGYQFVGAPFTGQGGSTFTHEVGHYLGLPHTWGFTNNSQAGCDADDGIEDTPTISGPSNYFGGCGNGFPEGPESCGNEAMIVNYMDYVSSNCRIAFTNGQIAVMRAVLDGTINQLGWVSRQTLLDNVETICNPEDIAGIRYDLALTSIVSPAGVSCPDIDITPKVVVVNEGSEIVNSFQVAYQVNNGILRRVNSEVQLAPGESTEVELRTFQVPSETYNFTARVEADIDQNIINDEKVQQIAVFNPTDLPFTEDFEDTDFNPTPNQVVAINFDGDNEEWQRALASPNGVGRRAARFNNFDEALAGTSDALILPPLDFSQIQGAVLSFDLAYAQYDPSLQILDDQLQILVSTDCGATYDAEIFQANSQSLATAPSLISAFTPTDDEWRNYEIDLNQFDGVEAVSISFVNNSGGGNRLYLDNINIDQNCSIIVEAQKEDLQCADNCNGEITISATSSNGELSYQWSDNAAGATGASATGLCAGQYTITVSDGSCSSVVSTELTAPGSILVNVITIDESGVNADDGKATPIISGGVGPYTYAWSNDGTTPVVNNLPPGDYQLSLTDSNGCLKVDDFTILAFQCSTSFGLSIDKEDVKCNGETTGSATLNFGDGIEASTINWSNGATGNSISNLAAGDYTVSLTDDSGCVESTPFSIMQPAPFSISLSANNETTQGANNGSAKVTPSGGTAPFTYAWSNDGTNDEIFLLAPGEYTVTVTDTNGCEEIGSVTVQAISCTGFGVSLNTTNQISCFETCDGALQVNTQGAEGEVNIRWSNGETTAQISGLCADNYSVTITDSRNCEVVEFTTISAPSELMLNASATPESGFELNNGSANASASGGTSSNNTYTYQWSNGGTTATINNLAPGEYRVTAMDNNGCSKIETVVVQAFVCTAEAPDVEVKSALCNATCNGAAGVVLSNGGEGFRFLWSNGATTQNVDGLCAGNYTVDITDGNNCTSRKTFVIEQPQALSLEVQSTPESALGANDGQAIATVSGGTAQYQFRWSNGFTGANPTGLTPGSYGLTVTDANECQVIRNFIVERFVCPAASVTNQSSNTLCVGECNGAATINVQGLAEGYSINWSNGATGATANNLCPGRYNVTVVDAFNCSNTTEVVIGEATGLSPNVSTTNETSVGANDGTASATVAGGTGDYNFRWSNGSSNASINNLAPGNYSVSITDSNGCEVVDNFTIASVQCNSLSANISSDNLACFEACSGTAQINVSGAAGEVDITWSNGQKTPSISGLCAGDYAVTVMDGVGCSVIENVVISQPAELSIGLQTESETALNAQDGKINASPNGGAGNYTYQWSNGATQSQLSNLPPGDYSVTVTDQNGCEKISATTITAYQCNSISLGIVSIQNVICGGECSGLIDIDPSGGDGELEITWSNGQSGKFIEFLCQGEYQVTVKDAAGCAIQETFVIDEPDQLNVQVSKTDETANNADDGTISTTVTGGVGNYNYRWSNGATTSSVSDLEPGEYTVSITDANDCEIIETISIASLQCNSLSANISQSDISCFDACDGSAQVNISGAAGEVDVTWSNGEKTAIVNGLCVGEYTVTVVDGVGCSVSTRVSISEPLELQVGINPSSESAQNAADGKIETTTSGGTGTYTYQWSNGSSDSNLEGLAPGDYSLTVTDQSGCQQITSSTISAYQCNSISINLISMTPISCVGDCNGTIEIDPSGGDGELEIVWSNGERGRSPQQLCAGPQEVEIRDAAGCSIKETFTIEEPSDLIIEISSSDETANSANDGSAEITITGGTGDYEIEWSNGATITSLSDLEPGFYEVTVIDENGCEVKASVNILAFNCSAIAFTQQAASVSCFGACDGTATISLTASEGYTIEWSNGTMGLRAENLCAGNYTAKITSPDNCTATASFDIEEPVELEASIQIEIGDCESLSSAMVNVEGGEGPYEIEWSNGATSTSVLDLENGLYQVSIMDAKGCEVMDEIEINNPSEILSFETTKMDVSCFGTNNASISVNILTGTPPFDYQWSTGDTTSSITTLGPADYSLIVTDANGCGVAQSFVVTEPDEITIAFTTTLDEENKIGTIAANAEGGTAPFIYSWSSGETTIEIKDAPFGNYIVTITDANGCTAERSTMLGTTSTQTIASLQSFDLYPNPTSDRINVELSFFQEETLFLNLYNLIGQRLLEETHTSKQLKRSLDLNHLPKGTYILQIMTEKGSVAKRFIIQ